MKKINKLFLTLIFTFIFSITNVFATLTIDEKSYDEKTSILTVGGSSSYGEVMVSAFKDDKPIAFKTTSSNNDKYQTTIKVSFSEDSKIVIKVGDIGSNDYRITELNVKKSLEPVPSKTISDEQGNSVTVVKGLASFKDEDVLILGVNTNLSNLSEEEQNILNFVQRQLGDSKKIAAAMELRIIRLNQEVVLEKEENGYLVLIKVPKEVVEQFKNVYIAYVDEEFNVSSGHEFTYDDELGGLVGYVDASGQFILYEDSDVSYQFIKDTANQTYNKDTNGDLTLIIDANRNKYKNIYIGNEEVSEKYTTIASGSTIITISKDYMKNLKLGNHTITVNYTDGKATTNLKVIQNEKEPNTVDNISKYIIIAVISIIALCGLTFFLLKRKKTN